MAAPYYSLRGPRRAHQLATGDTGSLGRADYRVVVFECDHCKRASGAALPENVRWDGQQIDVTHGAAGSR